MAGKAENGAPCAGTGSGCEKISAGEKGIRQGVQRAGLRAGGGHSVRQFHQGIVQGGLVPCTGQRVRQSNKPILSLIEQIGEHIRHHLTAQILHVGFLRDGEAGRKTQFGPVIAKHLQAVGVDGGNAGAAQIVQLSGKTAVAGMFGQGFVQLAADPLPQFGCRRPCKGYAQHTGYHRRGILGGDQFYDAFRQRGGLTRSCGGGEEQGFSRIVDGFPLCGCPAHLTHRHHLLLCGKFLS